MIEETEQIRVSFDSGGVGLVGHLHCPTDATGKVPCVVMGHGFSGTQDRLFANAERFVGAGFAVLTFDYRTFGESGGQPRQLVSIEGQLEDWRSAIRFARTLEGVDLERIALWGSSLGGGHVVCVAAEDPRIAAVVAQVPFNGFPRRVEGRSTLDTLKLLWAMGMDAARGILGRPPRYIPMVGKPGEVAVTATPQAQEHIASLSGESRDTLWRNEVAPPCTLWHDALPARRPGAPAPDADTGVDSRTRPRNARGALEADSRAGATRGVASLPGLPLRLLP